MVKVMVYERKYIVVKGRRKKSSQSRIVTFKIHAEMLEKIDRVWRKAGYKSRSEFIKDCIKLVMDLMVDKEALKK